LIDEADTFVSLSPPLRGILNSGHIAATAFVMRMDHGRPRRFRTWCPKVIALIGNLPDTLTDRSIIIPLKRKGPDERVELLDQAGADRPARSRWSRRQVCQTELENA
jgi:hypothetical protein